MKRFFAIGALLFLLLAAYISYAVVTVPDVQELKRTNPTTTALMTQRARENNRTVKPLRAWVGYNTISPHLRNAVLVAEDGAFFQHSGYDVTQIKESVKKNINERRFARGASTITQQLAKNLYLSTSKNPLRKLHEFLIAQELERNLTKQRIFEIYLNVIEWGDGIYGIQAASETYFGKPASALLPEEGAILAAMIPNPRRYTPARNGKYLERRKNELLRRLNAYRFLPSEEYEAARLRPIVYRQALAIP
jgi:monofunctional glycosyltransferase